MPLRELHPRRCSSAPAGWAHVQWIGACLSQGDAVRAAQQNGASKAQLMELMNDLLQLRQAYKTKTGTTLTTVSRGLCTPASFYSQTHIRTHS